MGIRSGRFPWGRVIDDIDVGKYTIRMFHPYKTDGVRVSNEVDETVTYYHGYIDNVDVFESWITLDECLAGLIVRANLGANHRHINEHFIAGIKAMNER